MANDEVVVTPLVRPEIPKELMHVSRYPEIKLTEDELPITMKGLPDVDFVKEFDVPTDGQNISAKLQAAIDKYAKKGGAKIHISKGDYQIGGVALASNIHLLFDKDATIRPYVRTLKSSGIFSVGNGGAIIENVSIQGVGGRVDVLLPEELAGFTSRFHFITSRMVRGFYYANFDIYGHKTVMPTVSFNVAKPNPEMFVGPTNGVMMNMTLIDGHFGYGLVQAQAGQDLRFYNLHGIGGITLRLETGSGTMNEAQFGGVHNIEGKNISVANGHSAVMCGPHGMKNGVVHMQYITALSSGSAFSIDETQEGSGDKKSGGHTGSFADGSSVYDVTAIYGTNAQIKTKQLYAIPWELRDEIDDKSLAGIYNKAPAHTCVRIGGNIKIDYDLATFHAIGFPEEFEYCKPIRFAKNKEDKVPEHQTRMANYIKEKFGAALPKPQR